MYSAEKRRVKPVTASLHQNACLMIFAKDNPDYRPLRASVDPEGLLMTDCELLAEELARILEGSWVRLWV